ncbi:hypothetical protein HYY75_00110 [bacterium]|nr:hypothetical protein [bacterium]
MKCRPKVKVRELFPSDRETIKTLLARSGFFEPYEIEVALELIDMALTKPDQKDYFFGVAEKAYYIRHIRYLLDMRGSFSSTGRNRKNSDGMG